MNLLTSNDSVKMPTNTILHYTSNKFQIVQGLNYGRQDSILKLYGDYKILHTVCQNEMFPEKISDQEYRFKLIGGQNYWIVGNISIFSNNGNFNVTTVTVYFKYVVLNDSNKEQSRSMIVRVNNSKQATQYVNVNFETDWNANGYISVYIVTDDIIDVNALQCFNFTTA